MNPTLLTAADIVAHLDANPSIEARAILARNLEDERHVLDPDEVTLCQAVLRGDPVARAAFPAARDRIMLRWSASTGPCSGSECHNGETSTLRGPAGASWDAPGSSSLSSRLAGAQGAGALPASPGKGMEYLEWYERRRREMARRETARDARRGDRDWVNPRKAAGLGNRKRVP